MRGNDDRKAFGLNWNKNSESVRGRGFGGKTRKQFSLHLEILRHPE